MLGEELGGRETAYLFRTALCSNWHVAFLYICIWSSNLACLRQRPHSGTNDHYKCKEGQIIPFANRVALHSKQINLVELLKRNQMSVQWLHCYKRKPIEESTKLQMHLGSA